jgi:hypothetical protein
METNMTILRKAVLATLIGAAPLAGCATGPYYDDYGYDRYGYGPGYGYAPGYVDPYYYGPGYVGPSVGLGFTYSDRDNRRYRRDRDGRRDRDARREGETRLERDVREGRRDPEGRFMDNPTGGDLGTGRDPRENPNNSPG